MQKKSQVGLMVNNPQWKLTYNVTSPEKKDIYWDRELFSKDKKIVNFLKDLSFAYFRY